MGTTYTRPVVNGTPTTGQVVKAAHVNEPIDQIYDTILAGGITDSQLASSSVTTAKLATAAVTRAKMDGTIPDGSAMATSAAPSADAEVANKKYVDDKWTPATYAGENSVTLGNGLIVKFNEKDVSGNGTDTITYGAPFPTAFVWANISYKGANANNDNPCSVQPKSGDATTKLEVTNGESAQRTLYWIAIGY